VRLRESGSEAAYLETTAREVPPVAERQSVLHGDEEEEEPPFLLLLL